MLIMGIFGCDEFPFGNGGLLNLRFQDMENDTGMTMMIRTFFDQLWFSVSTLAPLAALVS
jgi:hypothetical protein